MKTTLLGPLRDGGTPNLRCTVATIVPAYHSGGERRERRAAPDADGRTAVP